ncbi:TonB-dependent receptor [Bradyrhizobium sp. ISRA443]|uniref:TonB-dependent receptor n=1 Tax=unclassified Bradyrhizobium TaxID=2631580 RepID=UPI00247A7FE5|nr:MULTISPECIES: TonB-dependent receptor [unclassified Bradyrhizobium]WGR96900.1 TonB-dependent receptor [Bradyrhizobium sp. ISRA436]WGS03787.1 TonB-dependent receptor [Bradyrhizobium sp. ISRA437]WGS10671.1 TonB-dependent receptor [Bradyrhizobium sp. ISRA443]
MSNAKAPRSLRFDAGIGSADDNASYSGTKVSAVAGLIAVASFSGAEAQQANLPPVTVDAPVARPRPATSKPTPDQVRARTALRRAARRNQQAQVAPVPFPNAGSLAADRNPYADAAAPYKVDHLQASGKFPEPILNTPKSVTVLSKEVLEDKNATTLKQAILSTAGVTLGTGEGGNAFGDRFFIRGFDARNDIFIDGVRDPGVSVRENFFTEQVEILRGPGSSFAGRGTTGGAINIVTKQATAEKSFYNMDTTFGTDQTKRVTLDVNQAISPTFAVRAGGLFQDANVAGRDYVTDDRNGAFVATKWTPVDAVKVTADYVHTYLHGIPDFGVPYYRPGSPAPRNIFTSTAGGPFPDFGSPRNNFYGLVNRDFFKVRQDIGTVNTEVQVTPDLVLSDKIRASRSLNDYIGTLAESPVVTNPLSASTITMNPQSRHQVTDVLANQSEATYKFDTGGFRHTAVGGVEISRETSYIDKYTGLSSELTTGTPFTGSGSIPGVSVFAPQYTNTPFTTTPTLAGLPTNLSVDTKSVYLLDSVNYHDFAILNGGIRYDDYNISTSGYGTVSGATRFGAQSAEFGLPNFNLGLTLKPAPNGSVYAAYATSSNPIGAEFDGTSTAYGGLAPVINGNSNQIFGPEKNKAIEVGTKWELFDRHLLVTAALFQTEKENAREAQNITPTTGTATCPYPVTNPPTTGTVSCITAGAAYRIRGIDLGVGGKITDKWSVFGGLVLMQSEVTKSLAPSPQPLLYPTNVGRPLANVAHQSFSVLSKYQLTDMWEIGGQAVYRSKVYGGTLLAANQGTSIPSYWRFDAFAEAKVDKHWTVKLFVNNIFDKRYYDALYQSATPFVLEAPGRAAYLVVSARY